MKKEFNLTDKRQPNDNCLKNYPNKYVYFEEDLKEAIRILKEELNYVFDELVENGFINQTIDKIFGDKLI